MGGIGNQLFQFSFACMVAQQYGGRVALDLRGIPSRGQQKQSNIADLDVVFSSVKRGLNPFNYFWKIFILRSLSQNPSRLSDCVLGVKQRNEFALYSEKSHSVADFFEETQALDYFQGILPLQLRQVRDQVQDEYERVVAPNTITLHHRLGDSLSLKQSRGQLGRSYFRSAIHSIEQVTAKPPRIYIYTDDTQHSKRIMRDWLSDYELSWGPDDLSAAEVLTSLARARHLVMSNSTMSWWAGAGGSHENVIAPSEWTRQGDKHLCLDGWKRIEPDWN